LGKCASAWSSPFVWRFTFSCSAIIIATIAAIVKPPFQFFCHAIPAKMAVKNPEKKIDTTS
jgi:hypothetical protein